MATDIYTRIQGIADDLLTRFNQGTKVLILRIPGTGPAHAPGPSTDDPHPLIGTVRAVKGAVLLEPGSLIKTGDLKVTAKVIPGLSRLPTTSDKITLSGRTFTIIKFDPIPPEGIAAAWVFYVRK